nr:PREDICTED: uncharacterized protein LOC103312448 isoform X2 [Tribolium castaneum]|eukprot:XP_008191314.1 PREDICTED: uncharacterized protein LOC103312448 isoform X2 [Tribolium castaneum]
MSPKSKKKTMKDSEREEILYEALLQKCLKQNANDAPVDFDDMSDTELCDKHYSNKVKTSNLTPEEKKLVEKFEVSLKSTLHRCCLRREKAKIRCFSKLFRMFDAEYKMELRRLLSFASPEEIEQYVKLCVIPDDTVIDLIENKIQSKLKECLVEREKFIRNSNTSRTCEIQTMKEWNILLQAVQEDELVVYALHVLKEAGY